jgi:hypothetical protein
MLPPVRQLNLVSIFEVLAIFWRQERGQINYYVPPIQCSVRTSGGIVLRSSG